MTEIDLTQFSEHTTGPWRLDETDGCLTIHFSTLMNASFNMLSGEFASNIRLMAAAPELLVAYKAALARAERLDRELEVLSQSHKTIAHQLADEHCRAEAAEHQRDEAFTAGAEAMREDAKRIYWAGAKDMRELIAEKMIAFGKSVHTEALPEFPARAALKGEKKDEN